jgi:hypothetical protein
MFFSALSGTSGRGFRGFRGFTQGLYRLGIILA